MKILKNLLTRSFQLLFLFALSGTMYVLLEIMARGYSDISMFVLGGLCGVIIAFVNNGIFLSAETPFEIQVAFCATCCTLGELLTGIIVNQDFHVWDYRDLFGTFAGGQLNILFIFLWIGICIVSIPFLDWIEWRFLNGRKPEYQFLLK